MTKTLKIVLATYGTIGILFGLSYLAFPEQMSELQGAEELTPFLVSTKMALGAGLVPVGIFIVGASRDPIRHILWVRFAILFALLFLGVALFSGVVLFTDFRQALFGVVLHGTFAALLLLFYPRLPMRGGGQT